jgi:hypothetical protein
MLEERWEYNERVHLLFGEFEKVLWLRKVLYNILIEFGLPIKPIRHIKMCLNEPIVKFAKV